MRTLPVLVVICCFQKHSALVPHALRSRPTQIDGGFFTTFFSVFVVSSAAIAVAAKAIETAAANAAPR